MTQPRVIVGERVCRVHRLGLVPYEDAWRLQNRLAAEITAGERPPTLLLLEHPHTYTFGRSGNAANLLLDAADLQARQIEVQWVDRGGDVTYHGPGQLVGYPLLPLGAVDRSGRLPQADYVGYVRRLEEVLIRALASVGLATGQIRGLTGVWVQPDVASRCRHCPPEARRSPAKIAAIGVKVDARGVSRHGFALNVSPDMTYWDGIIACGLADSPNVALADVLEPAPALEMVADRIVEAFGGVFDLKMEDGEQL